MGGGKSGVWWLELLEEMQVVAAAFVGGRGSDMVVLQIGGGVVVEVGCRKVMRRMHAGEGVRRSWAGWFMNSCPAWV